MTLSRSPQCRAFRRVVMAEKSLSPQFSVGGREEGTVVTNEFCITCQQVHYPESRHHPLCGG